MTIQDEGTIAAATADSVEGTAPQAGSFTFRFADESWQWSAEVECMYGYRPGEAKPTTEMVLSHGHPDDQSQVAATLGEIVRTGRPFSARHRIVDVRGAVRDVIVVGDTLCDDNGLVVGIRGYYVDVTRSPERAHQDVVTEAVAEIAESRSCIEQAKGMLMMVYQIDAAAAFDLLRWRSQASNVKLRAIAERVVEDFRGLAYADVLPLRSSCDHLLLTAHERIDRPE